MKKIKIGIVGATGYTGVELLRLLANHPYAEVVAVTSRSEAGIHIADYFPSLRGVYDLRFENPESNQDSKNNILDKCDAVFFATPHGVAMRDAPDLVAKNIKVIDLSADFRIKNIETWEKWYGLKFTEPAKKLLENSNQNLNQNPNQNSNQVVYGLCELNREQIQQASLVANPGCYPTCVSLPLIPLLKAGVILEDKPLISDCKSGVSGAGRKANVGTLLCEAGDNFKAYGVAGHRHLPEIRQTINQLSSNNQIANHFIFVPHLTPMIRGMHATTYVHLKDGTNPQILLEKYYENSVFVDVMPEGSTPETRSVRGANICRIAVQKAPECDENIWILMSVQDNLVKGAAGQAIQNFNLMFGLDEATGLNQVGLLP